MKPKSAHNKGKRFENLICQEIEAEGFGKARREIGSGSGTRKGDIFANIPFLIEAKNQKKLNWWQSIDQAKKQAEIGNWDRDKWALIVRDPRTPEKKPDIYAVIDFWEFLKLMKKR
jgi:Holliday junction resolvase